MPAAIARPDPHHLVGAPLELVRHGLDDGVEAGLLQVRRTFFDVGRLAAVQRHDREDTNFGGHAAHFAHGRQMKVLTELTAVQEKEV
jgi:hypothetical protein